MIVSRDVWQVKVYLLIPYAFEIHSIHLNLAKLALTIDRLCVSGRSIEKLAQQYF